MSVALLLLLLSSMDVQAQVKEFTIDTSDLKSHIFVRTFERGRKPDTINSGSTFRLNRMNGCEPSTQNVATTYVFTDLSFMSNVTKVRIKDPQCYPSNMNSYIISSRYMATDTVIDNITMVTIANLIASFNHSDPEYVGTEFESQVDDAMRGLCIRPILNIRNANAKNLVSGTGNECPISSKETQQGGKKASEQAFEFTQGRLFAMVFSGFKKGSPICLHHEITFEEMAIEMFGNGRDHDRMNSELRPSIPPFYVDNRYTCSYRLFNLQYPAYMRPVVVKQRFKQLRVNVEMPAFLKKIQFYLKSEHTIKLLRSTMKMYVLACYPMLGVADSCRKIICEMVESKKNQNNNKASPFMLQCVNKKGLLYMTHLIIELEGLSRFPSFLQIVIIAKPTHITVEQLGNYIENYRKIKFDNKSKWKITSTIFIMLLIFALPALLYVVWVLRNGWIRNMHDKELDSQVTKLESNLECRLSGHMHYLLASNSNDFINFKKEIQNIPDKSKDVQYNLANSSA